MIKSIKHSNLSPAEAEELQQHINTEFGHVAFVQQHAWAQPDWTFIKYENERIAAFFSVVMREVSLDGQKYKTAGFNNVITPKAFRGKGYATELLKYTENVLFTQMGCVFGMLLCADALVPFYSRLGWYRVNATLYYDQPTGRQRYDSNVMLFSPDGQPQVHPQLIDLNGLPW